VRQRKHLLSGIAILEVDRNALAKAPRVSHLFQHIEGKEARVWEALEVCESPEAARLVEMRSRLGKLERDAVPFEAIALAAGMTPTKAFGVVSEAIVEYSQAAAKLILQAATPKLMADAVQRGMGPDGTADGKILLQSVGLLHRPKGNTTVIQGDVVKGNKNTVVTLPSQEDRSRRLTTRFSAEMASPMIEAPVESAYDPGDDLEISRD
jgi:hypothetical protein